MAFFRGRKILVIASIFVIIVGLVLIVYTIFGDGEVEYDQVAVAKGDVVQNVSVTGTVIPAKQIDLQFEAQGQVDEITVVVGDNVTAGQTLIELDTGELAAQLQAYQAAYSLAQAKLAKTLAGSREEDIKVYQTAVGQAQIDLAAEEQALVDAQEDADNDLTQAYEDALDTLRTVYTKLDKAVSVTFVDIRKEYFNGSGQLSYTIQDEEDKTEESLAAAKTALDTAEASLGYDDIDTALNEMQSAAIRCRTAFSVLRSAMDDPSVTNDVTSADKTTVDTERTTIDSELVSLTTAEQTIATTKITNQTNLNTAQADVDAAEADLQKAEDELALAQAEPRVEDVDLARAEVSQAAADIRQAQAKINKRILTAPLDGLVTAIEKEEGETAESGSVILSMIGTDLFQIEANISETEIAKVDLNDEVSITLDALGPDEEFEGRIVAIDPAETVISGVIYYQVTSVFDVEDERVKSGMTANLDIHTASRENVLYLPYYVIQRDNSHRYVLVMESRGRIVKRDLRIGLEGEMRVEILEGVTEGEIVVIEK